MIRNREELATTRAHDLALSCVEAGIEAAHPVTVLRNTVSYEDGILTIDGTDYELDQYSEVVVIGGGNAAGHVVSGLEDILGPRLDGGMVVTDDPTETERVRMLEADHPVPTARGVQSTRRVLERARAAGPETLLLTVITGGGSALLPGPAGEITLEELQTVTTELLESGATIQEMNAVRKHISDIKGGQLATAARPATVVGLVFSDVVGNELDVIASGPVTPDSTTFDDALAVVDRYDVSVPETVRKHLEDGRNDEHPETPSSMDAAFDQVTTHVVADAMTALEAARDVAREAGYDPVLLSSRVRGEAREAAKTHLAIAEEVAETGNPVEPPAALFSGGETTVTMTSDGTGGPNQEFAVSAALELSTEDIVVASVDTDGIDGVTDDAGALVDSDTCRGRTAEAREALATNNVNPFLETSGAFIETGATGTNVNDLRVLLIEE
jgi:hydroxypyruvate reductase